MNKMIVMRTNLLKKAKKSQRAMCHVPTSQRANVYKMSKNRVTRLIHQSKNDYFKTQVAENRNNAKKLWKLIKNLSKEDQNKHGSINLLVDKDGNQYFDNQQMVDSINTFYVNQPRDLLNFHRRPQVFYLLGLILRFLCLRLILYQFLIYPNLKLRTQID